MAKTFSYSKWAKGVAAQILECDLDCGFEVADNTPSREKAIKAMKNLIWKLKKAESLKS